MSLIGGFLGGQVLTALMEDKADDFSRCAALETDLSIEIFPKEFVLGGGKEGEFRLTGALSNERAIFQGDSDY